MKEATLHKRKRQAMKIGSIFDNIEIKLICLLLAIIMWFYANNPKNREIGESIAAIWRDSRGKVEFGEVPVKLVGLQSEWEAIPKEISLEVRCESTQVVVRDFKIVVNLAHEDEEKRKVVLTSENVELPKGMVFIKSEPGEIQLTAPL